MEDWSEVVARWGIETGYFDVHGRRHEADPEVLRLVIDALSAPGIAASPGVDHTSLAQLAYQGDGRRVWLLAIQLYGVRSSRNWGHGDFGDLMRLLEIVADVGAAGVGLNPLHALSYDDRPGVGSPYSPSSRHFLNPVYIDVEAVAEYRADRMTDFAAGIERLRHAELIDHAAVARLKLAALRVLFREFVAGGGPERRADFAAYRRQRGAALDFFAAFETLRGCLPGPWQSWPAEWQAPTDDVLRRLRLDRGEEFDFHAYLQWNAERQLQRCQEIALSHGLPIGLYLDTAIGVDACGADAWVEQGAMLRGLSIGAPPDAYSPAGQDWGLAAYNPHGLMARNFEPFRQMLRAAMRHSGAIRIDHVLGLMRLFVIPAGCAPSQGVYLRVPFDSMLAVAVEESRRWRCILIGEDLGTVPENFRARLSSWGAWSYLVMMFERNGDGSFRQSDQYPEMAIATFGTHDLAAFAGWVGGHDLDVKRSIGVDPGETDAERHNAIAALQAAVGHEPPRFDDVVAFLAATPTRLLSIAIEDVLGVVGQINVPGTTDQHPNWQQRWPIPLEELADNASLRRIAAILTRAGRGPARRW
jgi:4-alpha-glucanotransferase